MKRYLNTIFLLLLAFQAFGQVYNFHLYNSSNGLVHPSIKEIYQDKEGYLWFGTIVGVSKYDGYNFENLSGIDNSLSTEINGIVQTKSDDIWIATNEKGLAKFSKSKEFKRFNSDNSIIPDKIKRVCLTKSKDLIVLSSDNRFFLVLSDSQITPFLNDVRLPDVVFNDIMEIDNGYAIASSQGMLLVRYNRVQYKFTTAEGVKSNDVARVIYDKEGNIIFATSQGSIYKIKNNELNEVHISNSLTVNSHVSLITSFDGAIWLGTDNGILRIEGNRKDFISYQNGLPHNNVTTLFEDRESNLWVGTLNGAVKLNTLAYKNYPSLFPNTSSAVQKIFKGDKEIWIFSNEGISIYNIQTKTWKNIPQNFRGSSRVNDIIEYSGTIKLLATNDGIKELQSERITESSLNRLLPTRIVKSLGKDYNNYLYVGTDSGLFVIKNNRLENRYTIENEFPNNVINSVHVTLKNEILVGTESGLVKIFEDNVIVLKTNNGLIGNFVTSITDDQNDKFWIGTKKGISSLKNGRFTNYSPKFGLIETESVEKLILDKHGTIWAATLKGLYLIQPRNQFTTLNSKDGILSDAIVDLEYDETNDLVFVGTNAGLTLIEQKYLNKKAFTHQLTFTSFETNAKVYPLNEIILPESENEIHLTVSLFSFIDERRIVYRYRLKNLSDNWDYLTGTNKIVYKDLPSGNYNLFVQASLDGYNWLDNSAELRFTIKSELFTKWYFYVIALFLLLSVLLLIWYLREGKRETENTYLRVKTESKLSKPETGNDIAPHSYPEAGISKETIIKTHPEEFEILQRKFQEKTEYYKEMLAKKETEIEKLRDEIKELKMRLLTKTDETLIPEEEEYTVDQSKFKIIVQNSERVEEVREYISALEKTDWNIRKAARLLNLPHSTFHYRLKKLNLLKKDDK